MQLLLIDAGDGCATATALAARYGFVPITEIPAAGHYLSFCDGRLELLEVGDKARVCVDFVDGASAHRRKFGGGRGQPVAKAVGLKGGANPSVLDATAGQGRDAFVLASLGCSVTLIERSPVAAALLEDGLARAAADAGTAAIAARMTLVHADSLQWLLEAAAQSFDVVFLDPMFPEPDKRAKSKKEMAMFQTLIGGDPDADALLAPARRIARQRVVVKRPRHAPWLAGIKPNFDYPGESTRFDAYLPLLSS
ncbi:ribosomal RNA small subunit methyltransferase J [Jeongeupia sp. HS-3]|uniref:class I SAM-dependent methyltransferase n=1 Tax=Jeongeupia sp. HS-3 TaxID=1009682 RepID=UPI0018A45760|nr:class I SAM-dependent methyltransferase [Jeongeupia sp. HS-3]BCL74417.1 ribosomal RNA small subunit methyltransferase J [Jeongeupia sp. HS-3]